MSDLEDLEHWHRLYEQGLDPDHDCRANAEWAESGSFGYTVYGPCSVCGRDPNRAVAVEPAAPKPKINLLRLAVIIGVVTVYVVSSVLFMTLTELGGVAWAATPMFMIGVVLAAELARSIGSLLWDWIRE
ncbi:hypothetical protein [Streptomyces sp. S1]|uniref:hypothetical protein n=1 Tax=Streptomyces sp. S1 TaxID=718288 RepID=UPI003D7455E5